MDDPQKKEQRLLRQRIEVLERENHALKKSLYELSTRFNAQKVQPFALQEVLNTQDNAKTPIFKDIEDSQRKKQFYQKSELKGHAGAVYSVKFSPCGRFLGSGSFDKTVRIWDWSSQKEQTLLTGHTLNISDLSWTHSSDLLLSGGYDQSCKVWDVEQGKMLESYDADGFVQCVAFNPQNSNNFFFGTSRNVLEMKDRRLQSSPLVFKNDSMVNTIYVYVDGLYVVSGDANGNLKTWDTRTGKCISIIPNEQGQNPISHIASCDVGDEESRFFAVNSYDNVMRVYDRGIIEPYTSLTLLHALKGHKNKNWPIKSAFFKTRENSFAKSFLGNTISGEDLYQTPDLSQETREGHSFDGSKVSEVYALLATGSADPFIYMYSIGVTEGSSEMVQRIEGHTDRVYACHFHPTELLLASGSADFTVRIWSLNSRKRLK